jgi:hypothetical protein
MKLSILDLLKESDKKVKIDSPKYGVVGYIRNDYVGAYSSSSTRIDTIVKKLKDYGIKAQSASNGKQFTLEIHKKDLKKSIGVLNDYINENIAELYARIVETLPR